MGTSWLSGCGSSGPLIQRPVSLAFAQRYLSKAHRVAPVDSGMEFALLALVVEESDDRSW